jgi:hypothetical protein
VLPKTKDDNKVRELVLNRLLKDARSVERAIASIRREFLLDLSTGFAYGVLPGRAAEAPGVTSGRGASPGKSW